MTEARWQRSAASWSRRSSLAALLALGTAGVVRPVQSQTGTVKVGFLRHYEPFSQHGPHGNGLGGFDVDVMARLCEVMQWRLQPVGDTLTGLVRRLNEGDIAWVGNQLLATVENRRQFDFVRPAYASIQLSGVQHEDDNRDFLSLEDLYGYRLGVLARTGVEEQARGVLGKGVLAYEHIEQALRDLAQQKLDLVLEENLIADYHIEKHRLPLKVTAPFAAPLPVGLAVRKGDAAMQAKLSEALQQILQDGSLRRISEAWFGYDVSRRRFSHAASQ